MSRYDLIIRGGTIHDGSGRAGFAGDVGISNGRIAAIGTLSGGAKRVLDADGALVAPGFVDIHTHYDGQATWGQRMSPSSHHGVTTVVMGNCGVGFAPVRGHDRQKLVELMEGVEDIPGAALHEGLSWEWESFGDYLDQLDGRHYDMDVAAQLPHGPVRLYVMGERGANREAATPDDIAAMRKIVAEAATAGAIGFSTSRTLNHRSSKGDPTPSLTASRAELTGLAMGLRDAGRGVLQLISDFDDLEDEFDTFEAMVAASGRPLSLSLGQGVGGNYRRILQRMSHANRHGRAMRAQVAPRPIGILLGLTATLNPLMAQPSYAAIRHLPLAERVARLRDPQFKATLLAEQPAEIYQRLRRLIGRFDRTWVLGDSPDYEPNPHDSIEARAAREGRTPLELTYDLALADDGRALFYVPFANYADNNLDAVREMMLHPHTVIGLGDGGAHVGTICDASFTTTLLSHWARDRDHARVPLPLLIKSQTRDTALTVGLADRGVLKPGMRADLNVIDFANLRVRTPQIVNDLPAGGARLQQLADGYTFTVVAGEVTYENGVATEALPGRLVRGAQTEPVA